MSNLRYLEIDSNYRNRTQYPDPADFVVFLSQSGTKSACNARDPVSLAAPNRVWSPASYVLPVGTVKASFVNNASHFIVSYPVNTVSKVIDYYVGSPIKVTNMTIVSIGVISDWDFLSTDGVVDCFIVDISPSVSIPVIDMQAGGQTVNFLQGTDLADSPPVIFIPNGVHADNYYVGYIIYNQTLNEWRPIISYDGSNKLVGVNTLAPYDHLNGWNLTDTFVLRKTAPIEYGNLTIFSPISVQLPPTSSDNVNIYEGSFIRFTSGPNNDKICIITDYTGNGVILNQHAPCMTTPHGARLNCSLLPPAPPVMTTPHVASLNCSLLPDPDPISYEILQFYKDNEVPFMYTGSSISQQEMVCYEIELIDLVLPNKILDNGGRSVFYPYVYVELQNVSAPGAGLTNIIYSNNPNSTRKLFRCPLDDIQNPLTVSFMKIDSDGTKQTIKFKPNDNLHFAVYLPNGKLFRPLCPETYSPDVPNPLIQITALFSLKRL